MSWQFFIDLWNQKKIMIFFNKLIFKMINNVNLKIYSLLKISLYVLILLISFSCNTNLDSEVINKNQKQQHWKLAALGPCLTWIIFMSSHWPLLFPRVQNTTLIAFSCFVFKRTWPLEQIAFIWMNGTLPHERIQDLTQSGNYL